MSYIERRLFIGISRHEMRMQCGLQIAEHRIVDSQRTRLGEQGIAEGRHIREKLGSGKRVEIVQMGDHGVRQEEAITTQELTFTENRPTGRQATDQRWVASLTQSLDTTMNCGHYEPTAGSRKMKYTAPSMHKAAQR